MGTVHVLILLLPSTSSCSFTLPPSFLPPVGESSWEGEGAHLSKQSGPMSYCHNVDGIRTIQFTIFTSCDSKKLELETYTPNKNKVLFLLLPCFLLPQPSCFHLCLAPPPSPLSRQTHSASRALFFWPRWKCFSKPSWAMHKERPHTRERHHCP